MYITPNYFSKTYKPAFYAKLDVSSLEYKVFTPKEYRNYIRDFEYDESGISKILKTCDFIVEKKNIMCAALIEKCHQDIEHAILTNQPQEKISALFEILNLFLKKLEYKAK